MKKEGFKALFFMKADFQTSITILSFLLPPTVTFSKNSNLAKLPDTKSITQFLVTFVHILKV